MVGLIRPYLKYSAYHYGLRVQKEASATKRTLETTNESWVYDAILEKAWSRLYSEWETNIKQYLKDQREWNGFEDDFDWSIGDFDNVERAEASIRCFGVEVPTAFMADIKKMKTSSVEEYLLQSKQIEKFWYELERFEKFRLEPYP